LLKNTVEKTNCILYHVVLLIHITDLSFIIVFIIVVLFDFDRFVKLTTNCKTLGEGIDI